MGSTSEKITEKRMDEALGAELEKDKEFWKSLTHKHHINHGLPATGNNGLLYMAHYKALPEGMLLYWIFRWHFNRGRKGELWQENCFYTGGHVQHGCHV
mgnify:CR=1 FL=1